MKLRPILILLTLLASILGSPTTMLAQAKKPNILVIWGDDIGIANVSAYSSGVMGYETPNIDPFSRTSVNGARTPDVVVCSFPAYRNESRQW